MSDATERVSCPQCGANNFPSSAVCWQCGRPMRAQQDQPPATPPPTGRPPQDAGPTPPPIYASPQRQGDTQIYITLGWIFAVLSVVPICCFWLFGITAIILGIIAYTRGDNRGLWVVGAAVLALLISWLLTTLLAASFQRMLPDLMRDMQPQPTAPAPPPMPGI